MPEAGKASANPPNARTRAKKRRAPARVATYAYALPDELTKGLDLEPPPPGVRIALVATTAAAEKKLRAWAPVRMGQREWRAYQFKRQFPKAMPKLAADAYEPSSRARALLRGYEIAEADLKEAGGAFDLEQAQALLNGVSRQAIEKRVKEGSLLAVPGPSNRRRYPAAQFTRDGLVPGLKEVQEALPTRNPWAVLNFFVRPDDRLGGRKPIDVLRQGDVDLVVSAARGMGVQGG